jgi:tripartite-type tricarboxylate transporter receptor subunit TctC
MPILTRRAALAAAGALAATGGARAQAWPSRPIRIIVPFPPGGSNDVFARPIAEKLQARLGQPVVVENRPGAGGAIGAGQVAQSAPDGHTLMVTSSSFATSAVVQRTPYDAERDFEPVALLARAPMLIVVAPNFPANSVQDLVRIARERPGGVDFGSSGPGGINHFVTELLNLRAGIQMNHVPYRGMPPAVTDLVAGHIQLIVTTAASASGPLRDGRVRLLAYTAPGAPEGSPPAPTVRESGIDFEADIWWGLFAPRGLPAETRRALNAAVNEALAAPEIVRLFQAEGGRPTPETPEFFAALFRDDTARFREVARVANIRLE